MNHSVLRNFISGPQINDLKYTIDIHIYNLNYISVKPLESERDKIEILALLKIENRRVRVPLKFIYAINDNMLLTNIYYKENYPNWKQAKFRVLFTSE